jgi:hypothetical protein
MYYIMNKRNVLFFFFLSLIINLKHRKKVLGLCNKIKRMQSLSLVILFYKCTDSLKKSLHSNENHYKYALLVGVCVLFVQINFLDILFLNAFAAITN